MSFPGFMYSYDFQNSGNIYIEFAAAAVSGAAVMFCLYDDVTRVCDKMTKDLSGLVLEGAVDIEENFEVEEGSFVRYAAERAMNGGGMQ